MGSGCRALFERGEVKFGPLYAPVWTAVEGRGVGEQPRLGRGSKRTYSLP